MRVRETNELARRYVAPAPSLRMHFDDGPSLPFPPGTPVAYEPPRTPANGIPQTFSSRRFRSEGRGKRRNLEDQKRDTIHAGPFCGAARPGTVFRDEASLALPRNRSMTHKASTKKSSYDHRIAMMEAALDGRSSTVEDDNASSISANHRGGDAACGGGPGGGPTAAAANCVTACGAACGGALANQNPANRAPSAIPVIRPMHQ